MLIESFGFEKTRGITYKIISCLIFLISHSTIYYFYINQLDFYALFIYPVMYLLIFFFIFGRIRVPSIYIAILSEFVIVLLSSSLTFAFINSTNLSQESLAIITILFTRLVFFLFMIFMRNNHNLKNVSLISRDIPKHIYVFIFIIIIDISAIASLNEYRTFNPLKEQLIAILTIILTISLIVLIISLLLNVIAKKHFGDINSILEKQIKMQISHYENTEELNNNIRIFKHDYINHLSSLHSLIKNKKIEESREYIEKLICIKPQDEIIFRTGNYLADAILSNKYDSCKEFSKIEFEGNIPEKIDNSELCVILSNSLDNAIEACEKCGKQCLIKIKSNLVGDYFVYSISNPTVIQNNFTDIPKTDKSDKKSHGFGLYNIKNTVNKNDGELRINCENNIFNLTVSYRV